MLEKVKFQYILLSAVELPFACFSIHLKGESEIAYVRASILVLSRAYAIEDLFCVTHSGQYALLPSTDWDNCLSTISRKPFSGALLKPGRKKPKPCVMLCAIRS
jgi:hypothetical protein